MSDKKSADRPPEGPSSTPAARRISKPRPKTHPGNNIATAPPESATVPPAADAGQEVGPTSSRGASILPAVVEARQEVRPASFHGDELATPTSSPKLAASDAPLTSQSDWPEPEAPAGGGAASSEGKRKRRRRKGKAPVASAHAAPPEESHAAHAAAEVTAPVSPAPPRGPQASPRQQSVRTKIDPETLSLKAWKIFLAEVSEEGIALIGDQDARELARRCFRLAEIFIEEQVRRR